MLLPLIPLLSDTQLSSIGATGGVLGDVTLVLAGRAGDAAFGGAMGPDEATRMFDIMAGAEVLRLRRPGLAAGSVELARIPFFLLAFRSSLCFRRNSARSALEIPSSTSGPVVLPFRAFWPKHNAHVADAPKNIKHAVTTTQIRTRQAKRQKQVFVLLRTLAWQEMSTSNGHIRIYW